MSIDRYGYAPTDSTAADNKPMLVVANRKLDRNRNECYDEDVAVLNEHQRVNEERKERREMDHRAVKAGAAAIVALVVIALASRQSPESVSNIPNLGPILGVLGVTVLMGGLVGSVLLFKNLTSQTKNLKRKTRPARVKRQSSWCRRRP